MKIRVCDFETTGIPSQTEPHAICEVAWYDVLYSSACGEIDVEKAHQTFINPGRSMPPEARAVHHISDDDLFGAPSSTEVFLELMHGADVFCAHNAAFERQFFTGGDRPWICTYKAALRVWPEAPNHTNQCLRYWLGLELDPAQAMPPHRAGPDAYVTAAILTSLLKAASVDQLIDWTSEPALLVKVNFGKHRGQKWSDVPVDYLDWIQRQRDMDPDVVHTAKHHLTSREISR